MTVGELKDFLLKNPGDVIKRAGKSLTGVIGASVTKLMDTCTRWFVHRAEDLLLPLQGEDDAGIAGDARRRACSRIIILRMICGGLPLLTYYGLSQGEGTRCSGSIRRSTPWKTFRRSFGISIKSANARGSPNADLRFGAHQNAAGLPGAGRASWRSCSRAWRGRKRHC